MRVSEKPAYTANSVPEGRQKVAQGVSPGYDEPRRRSPEGAAVALRPPLRGSLPVEESGTALLGRQKRAENDGPEWPSYTFSMSCSLSCCNFIPGLTPWLTTFALRAL